MGHNLPNFNILIIERFNKLVITRLRYFLRTILFHYFIAAYNRKFPSIVPGISNFIYQLFFCSLFIL